MAMALSGDDLARSGRQSFGSSRNGSRDDDEEELRWAAIERLPTYDRMRKSVLTRVLEDGMEKASEVDVTKLGTDDKRRLMNRILDQDNETFLQRLRSRCNRCV